MNIFNQLELRQFKSQIVSNLNRLVDSDRAINLAELQDAIIFEKMDSEPEFIPTGNISETDTYLVME